MFGVKDITELHEREEEIENKNRFVTEIIESIPDPLAVMDKENTWININGGWKRVLGYGGEELLNKKVEELPIIIPERMIEVEKIAEENIERAHRGEIIEFEYAFKAKDGREVPVLVSEALIPSIDGRIIMAKDITELRRREEDLNEAVETFGEVLSSASAGDLSARVDQSKISEDYKPVGEDINSMIQAAQKSTKDLEDLLRELSTSCIKLCDKIVAMPLIGSMTSDRVRDAMNTILNSITENNARVAVIDITGVPAIDTMVAERLIRTVKSIGILGAEPVVTGISPNIASTLVGLGVELEVVTKSSLAEGLAYAFERINKEVIEKPRD